MLTPLPRRDPAHPWRIRCAHIPLDPSHLTRPLVPSPLRMRSITQVLRQQARSISATAQRLQLLGDDWGVPPSGESNAACASESRAVRQKRYEEVSQATPNGRLGPGDETTVGKQGFMAGKQGGIHRDHGSCAYRRQKSSRQGRTRRAGWSWEVLEEKKLSGDAEHGVDDDCSRRG